MCDKRSWKNMKLLTRKQHIQNYKSKTAAGRKTVVSSGLMAITNELLGLVRVGVEITYIVYICINCVCKSTVTNMVTMLIVGVMLKKFDVHRI
jgi:hypothetical protein